MTLWQRVRRRDGPRTPPRDRVSRNVRPRGETLRMERETRSHPASGRSRLL